MSTKQGPTHVVVDGSNIATEGRSMPSLAQLSEAVGSFMDEYPDTAITVVVDATFGHRIDKKELKEFEAGIANNELVAPPAGAVGRGDAFVLGIANKAGSSVLSNDSFQEFHGEYTWLFDEGRLIGGKPVPHVGWVWVNRVPVRGPISRKATRGGGSGTGGRRGSGGRSRRDDRDDFEVRTGSPEASAPMPTPKAPPPGKSTAGRSVPTVPRPGASTAVNDSVAKPVPKGNEPVNELMPFLNFVEQHPIGSSVNGTVDAYSSHGAYITIADSGARGYIPLRLMANPAPRSAKSVMKIDESVTVVVVSFAASRRSIDCALPDMAGPALAEAPTSDIDLGATSSAPTKKRATKKAATKKATASDPSGVRHQMEPVLAKKRATKKAVSKKAATSDPSGVGLGSIGHQMGPAAKLSATPKQPAKKAATKKTAVKKDATKTTKTTATTTAAAKKVAAKKSAAKKSSSRKVTAAATRTPEPKKRAAAATKKKAVNRKATS
jgi:Zc3h12a-like Ribonuclease NYN domain/S1 RNA binding domain